MPDPTPTDVRLQPRRRRWNGLLDRLAPSPDAVEAGELLSVSETLGCVAIADAPLAVPVRVAGTIRSLTLRSRAQVPALEVDLYDGSSTVTLVFLGRRVIRGVTTGRRMIACGRVTRRGRDRVMFNPMYELLPG